MSVTKLPNQRNISRLILTPFQWRFTILIAGSAFLTCSVLYGVFYSFVQENYKLLIELSPMTEEVKKQLNSEAHFLSWIAIGASCVFTILSVIWGMLFSHRLVGPVFNMAHVVKSFREGHREARVQLRRNDEFKKLADELNLLLNQFDQKKKGISEV